MSEVFDPKEMLRKKILIEAERELMLKFYQRGRDYFVDEGILGNIYDVKTGKKLYTYVHSFGDKVEIKKAYPGIFCFTQEGTFYKITKKV